MVITLLLAAALVAPKFIGDMAHQMYQQGFDNYPPDTSFSFEHKSFKQSWFYSDAVTMIKFSAGIPEYDAMEWVLTSRIQHGPILFTHDGIKLGFAYVDTASSFTGLPQQGQALVDEYLEKGAITIKTLIDFEQLSHDYFVINAINIENDLNSATFGGLKVIGTSLLDYSLMKGEIILPSSQIISPDMAVDIADASGTYDLHNYNNEMLLGKTSLTMPSIQIVAKQNVTLLENLSITAETSEKSGKINVAESIALAKITAPVPITSFQYNIEINQLDPKALKLWAELSQKLQPASTGKEKLRELLTALLQEGLELNQQFQLHGMGGILSIDWDTSYVGLADGAHVLDVQDKKILAQAVNMHLLITVDKVVVLSSPFVTMIEPYMKQGFVVEKDGKFIANIKLTGGALTINDQPFPVESLFPLFEQAPVTQEP